MHHDIDPAAVKFSGAGSDYAAAVKSSDVRVDAFGDWLITDYQNDPPGIIELADAIGRRLAGLTTEVVEFDGNAWNAVIAADGVETSCMYTDDQAWLALPDAVLIVYRYWQATRELWRPARFDKRAAKFANRRQTQPVLPWELEDWDLVYFFVARWLRSSRQLLSFAVSARARVR